MRARSRKWKQLFCRNRLGDAGQDAPEPVWGCVRFYQGQDGELWDGVTVFTLRNAVSETMGADGYLWKLSRVSREDFRWQEIYSQYAAG